MTTVRTIGNTVQAPNVLAWLSTPMYGNRLQFGITRANGTGSGSTFGGGDLGTDLAEALTVIRADLAAGTLVLAKGAVYTDYTVKALGDDPYPQRDLALMLRAEEAIMDRDERDAAEAARNDAEQAEDPWGWEGESQAPEN